MHTDSDTTKNKAVRAATQTASVNQFTNHSKIKPRNQPLSSLLDADTLLYGREE